MRLSLSVRMGAWLLMGLNLLMALGCIWIFMRMAPAIAIIIERNEKSLQACEEMISLLALATDPAQDIPALKASFKAAYDRAETNITEPDEPAALAIISEGFETAFKNDLPSRRSVISAIIQLGNINRQAMIQEDIRAQQFGTAGAWGVVFMAISVFVIGLVFHRSLVRSLVMPMEEMHTVITACRSGDRMRRCTGSDLPREIRSVFDGINELLDSRRQNTLM